MLRTVNGVRLNVRQWGEGKPLLLVHGLGASADLWSNQVWEFSKERRVIALDLRGFGRSEKPADADSYRIEKFADDIIVLAQQLGLQKVDYLGTSMGGFIGLVAAAKKPALWDRLILCHTSAWMAIPKDILDSRLKALHDLEMDDYGALVAEQALGPNAHSVVLEWLAETIARNDHEAYRRVLTEGLAHFDFREEVKSIRQRTLVVVGECDRVIPPEHGAQLAEDLPSSKLVSIPDVGHLSYVERPETFNHAVLEFLSS